MMKFEKVSFHEFRSHFPDDQDGYIAARDAYDSITLPRRATPGSAGYDFYLPLPVCMSGNGDTKVIPTGVKVIMDPGYFLMCVPRSSLGVKYGFRIKNTMGVIDEDFVNGKTGGHILAYIETDTPVALHSGERFMQGVFVKYGVTEDDDPIASDRTGGYGSTGGIG